MNFDSENFIVLADMHAHIRFLPHQIITRALFRTHAPCAHTHKLRIFISFFIQPDLFSALMQWDVSSLIVIFAVYSLQKQNPHC